MKCADDTGIIGSCYNYRDHMGRTGQEYIIIVPGPSIHSI